ncbi:MAG: tRNA uridine-5-carboxymethylaminomethyl(34) synthesis GTPase MnmE [Bacteroidetes bacterium]|nr:MAG: tRNA uridine-5-carboxymethylaminomethyl(34) synthesis GTPase MnmE [Bacteroidota bacterium]TAG89462.1 MAG: tRNA uridine-5-carboxymethylaminomethyl(34) synthesis GTPase MnmE [Bacteroidota bacterium]
MILKTQKNDTIVALSTPVGVSAIAVIRLSGENCIAIIEQIWQGKKLSTQAGNTVLFGKIINENKDIIDEVVLALFKAPKSFTKQNVIEISCHGSGYIVQEIIKLCLKNGARLAEAGEFTQRAYLNGQFDLAQAEAIADLIHADSKASHQLAISQMRGGFSNKIKELRENLIKIAALLELELDFSEEDVEFANRTQLLTQVIDLQVVITNMANSFQLGNVMKNGFSVAIMGKPNAGKSTLLNALLEEDRAIVSNIAGTTRDTIEETKIINGIKFRFIDTAGLRETEDTIEKIGIERTLKKIKEAQYILYLFDMNTMTITELEEEEKNIVQPYQIPYCLVGNKIDLIDTKNVEAFEKLPNFIGISMYEPQKIQLLEDFLANYIQHISSQESQIIVNNTRHHQCLLEAADALQVVQNAINHRFATEMIASDLRQAIFHLGSIVGEVTNNDLLDFIFSKFCIGK